MLIFAMIQDQALVASKHYLIETKENSPGDKQVVGSTSEEVKAVYGMTSKC